MSDEDTLSFKIYLTKDGSKDPIEVRIIEIDKEKCNRVGALEKILKETFPQLIEEKFHLFWQDNQQDFIRIRTIEELKTSLKVQQGNLKTLTVRIVHGAICNACSCEIKGYRYKCLRCPDFDLCSSCEFKQLHPQHFMIRIPRPGETFQSYLNLGAIAWRNY